MTGGTGLYIKAFCEGIDHIPAIPEQVRAAIQESYKNNGLEWLQEQIKVRDRGYWMQAEQQNPQRLMRALEVLTFTGNSINTYFGIQKAKRSFHIRKIGLELPRAELYERINKRVDMMIQDGLIDEVVSLMPFRSLNALQTVGYKEIFDYLDGKTSLDFAIDEIRKNTRHYAKRQMTWFKKDNSIEWIHPNQTLDLMS